MRKLASIQRVLNIRPIQGADAIEVLDVLGWNVVAQKGLHKVGDLVVFIEIDSFLNANDPRYASFSERFSNFGTLRGMRVRSIRLRKQISQGLILPISNFSEISTQVAEGDDVTELLGVIKWESAEETKSNAGNSINKEAGAKPFPSFIRKTDQERCLWYDTKITMADGTHKNIIDVIIGDSIRSFDHDSGSMSINLVEDVIVSSSIDDWLDIEMEDGAVIRCTHNHKLYDVSLGEYKDADLFTVGDELMRC